MIWNPVIRVENDLFSISKVKQSWNVFAISKTSDHGGSPSANRTFEVMCLLFVTFAEQATAWLSLHRRDVWIRRVCNFTLFYHLLSQTSREPRRPPMEHDREYLAGSLAAVHPLASTSFKRNKFQWPCLQLSATADSTGDELDPRWFCYSRTARYIFIPSRKYLIFDHNYYRLFLYLIILKIVGWKICESMITFKESEIVSCAKLHFE